MGCRERRLSQRVVSGKFDRNLVKGFLENLARGKHELRTISLNPQRSMGRFNQLEEIGFFHHSCESNQMLRPFLKQNFDLPTSKGS